jgi:hypothetical protein
MKPWLLMIGGVVLLAVGVVWILQGLGTLAGSFMTGQKLWFAIGLLVAVGGLVALARGIRAVTARRGQ